jgi:hypothetical protein
MVFIYILLLENNKYYIGKTNNPEFRIENHFSSNGSSWTKIHNPIKVIELIPDCDDYDEDKYTKIYMDKYGIQNVRGGSFVKVNLDKETINQLTKMSNGSNNKCFYCGKEGHFINSCKEKEKEKNKDNEKDKKKDTFKIFEKIVDICETLIGDLWECEYCKKIFESKLLCEKHEKNCNKNSYKKNKLTTDITCYKCGRTGHYSTNCFASKHIKGYDL